jgi:hypothetical protein
VARFSVSSAPVSVAGAAVVVFGGFLLAIAGGTGGLGVVGRFPCPICGGIRRCVLLLVGGVLGILELFPAAAFSSAALASAGALSAASFSAFAAAS